MAIINTNEVYTNYIYEYVWIDAFNKCRSKIKITDICVHSNNAFDLLQWNFDGSSTGQSTTDKSDIILIPVSYFNNPFDYNQNSYILLCECVHGDLNQPFFTNNRSNLVDLFNQVKNEEPWFGIEQEYIIYDSLTRKPYNWEGRIEESVGMQGPYYCSVGGNCAFGREIVNEHMLMCLKANIKICGTNAEVMPSQWEFQVGPLNPIECADQLWVSRYILDRVCEKYNAYIEYHPKPFKNWNGSGCHTNFSTHNMRQSPDGLKIIVDYCNKLVADHKNTIEHYGLENEKRLIGIHETSSYNKCTYGIADRSASIRIPLQVYKNKCGYLEDRRPASNCDPYLVIYHILKKLF